MYKVIRAFKDTTDGRYYPAGSEYPAKGLKPSKSRIKALAEGDNKFGKEYIEEVKAQDSTQSTGEDDVSVDAPSTGEDE